MAKFEEQRAHLSHFVLRNGIIARLGVTSDVYEADNTASLELMANSILEIDEMSANHREAVKVWNGSSGYEPGVRRAMAELLTSARRLRTRRPSPEFPTSEEVGRWLDGMEAFLGHLEKFPKLRAEERRRLAVSFASGAINLLDFLRDLDIDSAGFKKYFERA